MSTLRLVLLHQVFHQARKVSRRAWLIVAGVALSLAALLIWAAAALAGTAWSQLPQLTASGKRALETATQGVDQFAPGIKQGVTDVLAGIGERAGSALPDADVSGTDIGPVGRYPGLIRAEFSRGAGEASVRYVGRAPLATVLAHYARGFTSAGYAHDIVSSKAGAEQHRFSSDSGAYALSLEHLDRGLLAVTLTQISN